MPDLLKYLNTPEPAQLGPGGRPGTQSREALERGVTPLLAASGYPEEAQQLIRALILLWHDYLEPAHELAQQVDTADGAFVHGIMHRREPDFGNASYWFRRVGPHPAYEHIAARAQELLRSGAEPELVARLVPQGRWDPFGFINACEAVGASEAAVRLLREVQRIEFEELLKALQTA